MSDQFEFYIFNVAVPALLVILGVSWLIFPWVVAGKFNKLLKLQTKIEHHLRALREAYEAQIK
jgi:hypothetical protein